MKPRQRITKIWNWLRESRKRLFISGAIVLTSFFVIWNSFLSNKSKVSYQTATVSRGTIVSSVSASGQILTSNLINVSTQASGVVKAVYVKDGDKVFAGQKIAEITLDSDGAVANAKAWVSLVSAQNAINAANNNYRSTQASVEKVHDDLKGHESDETFAQKETRTKAEVANDNAFDALRGVQASLSSASVSYRQSSPTIVAPVSGIVDNITITPGLVLSQSSSSTQTVSSRIAIIKSSGNPIATFNISEVDVNRVKQGQKATITLDSISGKTFTGKVLTVDKVGTVSSGVTNYPVLISFDTTAPEILPNMAATANIIIESKDSVLLVPSEAVQTSNDGGNTVRILRNGQPAEINIEVGLSSDTQTEVVTGLNEGDMVITGSSVGGISGGTGGVSPFSTFRVGGGGGGFRTGGSGR